jgi:di/tricarboxylate transporter
MFVLSAGLTRTGVAYRIGQPLQRFAHSGETTLIIALMVASSLLSALINTVTVAALLLPAVMDLARRSGLSPSRLLLPMSCGCLLGGPFTSISTSTNILVTDSLQAAGKGSFEIFDFTPITAIIVLGGIVFMVLIGRRLLPKGRPKRRSGENIESSYQLGEHIFSIQIASDSPLVGRTLVESRLGSALYLTVLCLKRAGQFMYSPQAAEKLQAGDILVVHGQTDNVNLFHGSQHLRVEPVDEALRLSRLAAARAVVRENSPLVGKSLVENGLRRDYHVHVLSMEEASGACLTDFHLRHMDVGDVLLLQGEEAALKRLEEDGLVTDLVPVSAAEVEEVACNDIRLASVRLPEGSVLAGRDLVESRLGNAFGLTVTALVREERVIVMPPPEEKLQGGDLLVVQGCQNDLDIFEGLQDLEVFEQSARLVADLESQRIGMTEVLLSPRTSLAGQTLNSLLFRERYGLNVLAVWRKGRARRQGLQAMPLKFGDALLVYGPRQRLEVVAHDPDFLMVDQVAARAPLLHKAPIAAAIMIAVLAGAVSGLMPISIAALAGSTLMVLFGCLKIEEAYRAVEWKVIFLTAAMLPLGMALENTGAAEMGAKAFISLVGDMGPRWVVGMLFAVTVLCVQVIPPTAIAVLMAPVALSTAAALNISPYLLMMTVAMGAASSFASPFSHAAHLLVMSPGGYKFTDYLKVGVPLTIIAFLACVVFLPIFWPA